MKPALTHDADCILTRGDLAAADWPSLVIWMGHCPRPRSTNVSRFLQLLYYVPRRLSGVRKQKNEKKEETKKKAQLLFVLLGIFMHLSYSSSYINSTNTAPRVDLVFAFGSVVSAIPPM